MKLIILNINKGRFSQKGLSILFLICALPLHFWTLLLSFRDVSWMTDRTNVWDAIGTISYGLLFAFFESFVVFVVFVLLGWLISLKWNETVRVNLLSVLVILLSFWGVFNQSFFLWNLSFPSWFLSLASQSSHPFRFLYSISLIVVSISIIIPVFLMFWFEIFFELVQTLIDRLTLLASFYIFFDFLALIIVIVRNV